MRIKVKSSTTEDTEITEELPKDLCVLRVLCGEGFAAKTELSS
jgi:hypothetical protein